MGNEWVCVEKIDITQLYKSEEGSKAERLSVYNAIRNVDRYVKYT